MPCHDGLRGGRSIHLGELAEIEIPRGDLAGLLHRATASDVEYRFDTCAQVVLPAWSRGRIELVGDAAYGPSPLSGQGVALVGAYVLAGELARAESDPAAGLGERRSPDRDADARLDLAVRQPGSAGMDRGCGSAPAPVRPQRPG